MHALFRRFFFWRLSIDVADRRPSRTEPGTSTNKGEDWTLSY